MQDEKHESVAVEKLSGLIVSTIFANEENGYHVVRLEIDGGHRSVVVSGNLGGVSEGEHLELEGEWYNHPTYGKQFKATHCRAHLPDTVEGLERYLGSGVIKGVGPGFASKIAEKFGSRLKVVLDTCPERLFEVKGLGKKKARAIIDFWTKRDSSREFLLFMGEHGVGLAMANRILKQYGENAEQVVKSDPYVLVREMRGVSFITADRIALRLGIPADSPMRLAAAVEYAIGRALNDGHCVVPRDEIEYWLPDSLKHSPDIFDTLKNLLESGRLLEYPEGFCLPLVAQWENEFAESLRERAKRRVLIKLSAEDALRFVPPGIRLGRDQTEAMKTILSSPVSVLTGGPGVGKTTLLRVLVNYLESRGIQPVLCAPTGRAAQRMEESSGAKASTIHRLLGVRPGSEEFFAHNEDNPLKGIFFIVDEFSMVDIHLAYSLFNAIQLHAHVLLIGDPDQLPSVGPGQVLRDIIDSSILPTYRLTEVFRQAAGSLLVRNSHKLLEKELPEETTSPDADFYFLESESFEHTYELMDKLILERIPKRFGDAIVRNIQILSPMKKGPLGTEALNTHYQQVINPKGRVLRSGGGKYRTGDKILQLVNCYEVDLFNGDMGVVVDENDDGMIVRFDRKDIVYDDNSLNDITLAYACTVHKSQGSEYPIVLMPIYEGHVNMLSIELLYTSLTRGKQLCVWVGKRRMLEKCLASPNNIHRKTRLGKLIKEVI